MKHFVHFHNADNHWDNGLPIGNGCFGAMLYFEDGKLYMEINLSVGGKSYDHIYFERKFAHNIYP